MLGRFPWFVSAALICFCFKVTGAKADAPCAVGVAAIDITPTYPVRLSGFGFRRTESEGVTQPIWAKALAIGDDDPAVLIAVDNLAIPASMVDEVAARLKKAGVQRDRLAVTATHTHTAPMLTNVCPTLFGVPIPPEHQKHIDQYTKELTDNLEKVALAALKDRAPATLSWAVGTVGFAINRRTKGGPVDHDLPMLVVKDAKGKIRAIYVSYACHCVTLSNNKISGDWAGYAQDILQRNHPGAVVLCSVGCGADSNPSSGVTGDKVDIAERQGADIAREVDRLLKGILRPVTGNLATRVSRFDLAFGTLPTRAQWEEKAKRKDAVGHHARVQLAKLDRGEKLQEKLPYSVQTWAFGDSLAMVFLPGEVVVDYSLRLKRELDPARLWVNAYANDEPCYIPSERVLKEGGYEGGDAMVYYDRPTRLKAGLEEQIVGAVHAQLEKAFKPPFDPKKLQGTRPLSPRQSEKSIKLKDGFVAELVAAEPLVQSPVAINWGPDGRLWVAEMVDYPTGIDGQFGPGGRIKVLEDTNGDGIYDKATIFLDNIPFPTGVTPWRKGVLICAAPDILYAEDTEDDRRAEPRQRPGHGKADVVKKLFSGWATHNYQARVNSLEYGLDGWVYGSGGIFGGEITSFAGGKPVPLTNRDFRINPDTGVIEAATGRSQHGRVRNDWGDWFGCDNSTLLRHYPLADHYLRRNPHVATPNNDVIVSDGPDGNRLYPLRDSLQLFKLSGPPGRATAACGLGIYRDDLLGKEYTGNAFTCEPVNLVVHRRVLDSIRSTFTSHRAPDEQQSEFLASTDNWFRPVQARTGPDGALYVVDMYRLVIEHPRWIPPDELAQVDVRAGYNRGRIYRIYHKDRPPRPIKRLDKLDSVGLVAALDSPNGPQRDLAMQMLVWRADKSAIPLLRKLADASERPEARLLALTALDGLEGLNDEAVAKAISDAHPGVRRHAIRLAGKLLSEAKKTPGVTRALWRALAQGKETDAQVLLEFAFQLDKPIISPASEVHQLVSLAVNRSDDPYLTAAVFSSLNKRNLSDFGAILTTNDVSDEILAGLVPPTIKMAVAMKNWPALKNVLDVVILPRDDTSYAAWQFAALARTLDALDGIKQPLGEVLSDWEMDAVKRACLQAREVVGDAKAKESRRLAALRLLGRHPALRKMDLETLAGQLNPRNSAMLQSAAAVSMGRMDDEQVPPLLLAGWKGHSPALRTQILDILLGRDASVRQLLAQLEKGDVSLADLDAARRQRLLQHKDSAIRERAAKLLAGAVNSDRKKVLDDYQSAQTLRGDHARGKEVFAKRCATCHQLDGVGHAVGPDLGQMANKSPQAILIAVLDPNQAVDARYIQYLAATKDGRQHNGILAGETATSITIREQDGKEKVILRTDLEELQSTGKSLMPEGLEKDVTKQDMADLIAYLGANTPPPNQSAGNQPALVKPASDGSLRLLATNGTIRGGEITFEPEFRNVGMWHGADDHVVWTAELDRPGSYDVYLNWACDDGVAGNILIVESAGKRLRHRIAGTGAGWSHYKLAKIGTLTVREGKQQITARPESQPHGALCDLRGLILVKEGAAEPRVEPIAQEKPKTIDDVARTLLDDARSTEERIRLIGDNPEHPAEILAAMVRDLKPGTKEEYRRIPWIWRVAIAAGKRNDTQQLRDILGVALPQTDERLRDWQAVVIGGGLINGLTQIGVWPSERLLELLKGQKNLTDRMALALEFAEMMADNEKVPTGTRYDALRMLGVRHWETTGKQIVKYLAKGTNDELQMGAVSALGDMRYPEAAKALLGNIGNFSKQNSELALDALVRNADRCMMLLDAIANGQVKVSVLGDKRMKTLLEHRDAKVQRKAHDVLGK
jgi:putative membrane-bound dehydrogenase-like protein